MAKVGKEIGRPWPNQPFVDGPLRPDQILLREWARAFLILSPCGHLLGHHAVF